jgi:hypothetical protein
VKCLKEKTNTKSQILHNEHKLASRILTRSTLKYAYNNLSEENSSILYLQICHTLKVTNYSPQNRDEKDNSERGITGKICEVSVESI